MGAEGGVGMQLQHVLPVGQDGEVRAIRIAARPAALDAASWPAAATVLRTAPDEVLLLDALDTSPPEADAIVFPDTSWSRFVLDPVVGADVIAAGAAWPPPTSGLGQGMVFGIPVKLVVESERWSIVVLSVVADEFEERLHEVLS